MRGQQLKQQNFYKQTRSLVFRCVDKYYPFFACLCLSPSVRMEELGSNSLDFSDIICILGFYLIVSRKPSLVTIGQK
jgi:hypothetical protein